MAPRPQGPGAVEGMLTVDEVAAMVATGELDTVVVAFCDMQGRLVGKRIQGEYFVDSVVRGGVEACVYLLADDMEMEPVRGYQIANPSSGYGDLSLKCDMDTLRRIPWLEGTALVLCDIALQDGTPVHEAPRQVLLDQYQRAYDLGYTLFTASELEFYVYRETYREAREAGYSGLEPLSSYNSDYHVLASTYAEPLIRTRAKIDLFIKGRFGVLAGAKPAKKRKAAKKA